MAAMALELGPPPKAGEERKSIGHVVLSALVCVPHAKGGEDEDDEEDEKKQENEEDKEEKKEEEEVQKEEEVTIEDEEVENAD